MRAVPAIVVGLFSAGLALAQAAPPGGAALSESQEALAQRFAEFESMVQRMAEVMAKTDPERAMLLRNVFARSREHLLAARLKELARVLSSDELSDALKAQESLAAELDSLLDLLLSEDRGRRLRERRELIERLVRDVQAVQSAQRELRQQTERDASSAPAPRLGEEQKKLAERTEALGRRLSPDGPSPQSRSGDAKPGEDSKEGKESKSAAPKEGPASESSPPAGSPPREESETQRAGRQRLESAAKRMRDAERKLEELKRKAATESQDQALRELEKAIEELEEILRQLREEEQMLLLTDLASRVRKMIEMQKIVEEGTQRLHRIPPEKRGRAEEQKALGLAQREAELGTEVGQALLLLREDGTSVAMLESLRTVDEDVRSIESRLKKADVGPITLGFEADVLETLEEMLAAVDRQIRERASKGAGQGQQGGDGSTPLVDKLAEIKMIRGLESRVLQRTQRLLEAARSGPGDESWAEALADLAERQAQIYRITKELATEKTP